LIICIFITARTVSFYLTRRLTNLIAGIDTNIENLMEGQELSFNAGNDEFTRIYIRFYEIIQKIREYYSKLCEYEKERKTLELEKKVLELELLQARINPHFLYNTLSALRFAFPNEKLSQLVASMAKYYRVALNRGENIIKVGDELDMVEEYLKIQKFTYISDFSYLIDMPENVRECMIIKHLLQPIVENAFIHGVSGVETGGVIKIIGGLYEGKLVFNIIDNGIGIEQEKIIRILNGENVSTYGGYGLRNVIRRIKTYYGNDYGLSIKSSLNEGTAVTVTIPYKA
jgi:sensor histidine kinase YesM